MRAFISITITLFFVIDAPGNVPTYLAFLKPLNKKKRQQVAIRELFIALGIMIIFRYLGRLLLIFLGVSTPTVQLAGGIILFLIAIRLVFSSEEEGIKWKLQEPFIVPIATPIIAGPSVLALIMILSQDTATDYVTMGAIVLAWFLSSLVFLFAKPIHRLVKDKGLSAVQSLMGLIVTLIAVQLFLQGIQGVIAS